MTEQGKYYFKHADYKTEFMNVLIFAKWTLEKFKEKYFPNGNPLTHEVTWGAEFMWDEIQKEILKHSDVSLQKQNTGKVRAGMKLETKN